MPRSISNVSFPVRARFVCLANDPARKIFSRWNCLSAAMRSVNRSLRKATCISAPSSCALDGRICAIKRSKRDEIRDEISIGASSPLREFLQCAKEGIVVYVEQQLLLLSDAHYKPCSNSG